MLPFIKDGIERGEHAFHIVVDSTFLEDHRERLAGVGIDVAELERRKQLEIAMWEQAHAASGGEFEVNNLLALVESVLSGTSHAGFSHTRLIGHMDWSLEAGGSVLDVLEYETRLNLVIPKYHDPVICIYDLSKFSAGFVIDILRTHPMVIIGGILQENPFYVQPDVFLRELQARQQ